MSDGQILAALGAAAVLNIAAAFWVVGVRPFAHLRWLRERKRRGGLL